jgi:RNase P/RNase MRP subunit POP5
MSKAAAMPPRCHQPAGSVPDERTCHHCTTAKPNATATGIIRTSRARVADVWLATAAPPASSAIKATKTTIHPVTPAVHGSVSSVDDVGR